MSVSSTPTGADLLPPLADPTDQEAIRFGPRALTYRELTGVAGHLASLVESKLRVAVWAVPALETCAAVVGALAAGVPVVPINPKAGERELAHIAADSSPSLLLTAPEAELPSQLAGVPRAEVDLGARGGSLPAEPSPEAPAVIVYTSGTTGPPKGVVLPRRAISSNLDALAAAWEWTGDDVLAHALPLFHVHGLILGVLGPLRLGGAVHHLERFSSAAMAAELAGPATMMFGVPTMYHRLAGDAERDPEIASGVSRARLLVSGSAALPATDHERIAAATGQRVVERYGMTETLMNCAVRAAGDRRPGPVGPPLDGVDIRLNPVTGGITANELKDHIRTFATVFPYVTAVRGPGGYGFFMLGSDEPIVLLDAVRLVQQLTGREARIEHHDHRRTAPEVGRHLMSLRRARRWRWGLLPGPDRLPGCSRRW